MEVSNQIFFLGILILSFFASYSEAQDGSATNSTNSTDYEDETITLPPDEVDTAITELMNKQCLILFGECWLTLKYRKSYFKEERRLAMCLKKVQGFMICESMTEDNAKAGKDAAEERFAKVKEEAEAHKKKIEEETVEKTRKREEANERRAQLAEQRANRKAGVEREGVV